MKLIKFDLPMNGKKIKDLEELTDNMTVEILGHYKSGLLGKWLKVRQHENEFSKLEQFAELDDSALLGALCTVFGVEISDEILAAIFLPTQRYEGIVINGSDECADEMTPILGDAIADQLADQMADCINEILSKFIPDEDFAYTYEGQLDSLTVHLDGLEFSALFALQGSMLSFADLLALDYFPRTDRIVKMYACLSDLCNSCSDKGVAKLTIVLEDIVNSNEN